MFCYNSVPQNMSHGNLLDDFGAQFVDGFEILAELFQG